MIQVGLQSLLKGLQLRSLPKVWILRLNGPKSSVKWNLKIWDFFQTRIQLVIGFLELFKGSFREKFRGWLGSEHIGHDYLFGFLPWQLVLIICLVLCLVFYFCVFFQLLWVAKFIIKVENETLLRIISIVYVIWFFPQ